MKAVTSSALLAILAVGAVAAELLEAETLPGARYDPLLERSQPIRAVPISIADYPPRSVRLLGPIGGSQPLADEPRPISDYLDGPRSNPISIPRSVRLIGPISGSQPLADEPRPISDYPDGPRSNPISIPRSVQLLERSEPLADDPIYLPRPKTIPIKVLRSFPSKPLADDPRPIADYIFLPRERSQPLKDDPPRFTDYGFRLRSNPIPVSQPRARYLLLRRSKPISIPRSVPLLERSQPLADNPISIADYPFLPRSNPIPIAQPRTDDYEAREPRAQGTVKLDGPIIFTQ